MSRNTSVVITGSNGFVGANVGQFLANNNFHVINLIRSSVKKKIPYGRTIVFQKLDENTLVEKIKNSHVLLHFIGKGKQTTTDDYTSVNVDMAKQAIRLCKKSNIQKIIYISGLGVSQDSTLGYFISKFQAEQEIINSGLDYTIFRSSYIIGKDDPLSQNLRNQIKRHTIMIPGSGNYHFQPIFIDDLSKIIIQAFQDQKFSNKIIDLVGPNVVSFNRFVQEFSKGHRVKIKKIDFEYAYRQALHNSGYFGIDDLSIMIGDYLGNHKKLARLTNIEFTRYTDVLKSSRFS